MRSCDNLSVNSLQVTTVPSLTPNKASPEKGQDTQRTDSQAEEKPQELKIKIDASTVPDDVMELVLQYLKDLHVEEKTKANETIISIWDFAGQHMYHTSHSVFLSPRALYILVHNLKKDLNAKAEPCARQGIHDIILENPNDETNLDNVLSWLASVHNICTPDETKKLPYLRPPVFVVGTHADQPSADPKAVEAHIKKSISGKSYEKHVIRPFFSVDNTKSSEDSGVQALRQRISEVLKQEPYMGVDLPTKWFNFEKVLRALIEKKIYHLQVSELSTIAKEVCFIDDDEEMMSMLSFYHDLGLIVKHGETVVLQSEWLIDCFSKLVTVSPFDEQVSVPVPNACIIIVKKRRVEALHFYIIVKEFWFYEK